MEKDIYRPGGKAHVHVNDNQILKIDQGYIDYLKSLAQQDKDKRCTMCLHNDVRAHVHEMLNVCPKNSYIRPHSHPFKTETKIVIEGKILLVIFDSGGRITDRFVMDRDGIFTVRIDKGIIHTNIPLTDTVFQEIITGPFVGKDDSVFPDWVPEAGDEEEIRKIMERIYYGMGEMERL